MPSYKALSNLGAPIFLSLGSATVMSTISGIFLARLGTDYIAAAGIVMIIFSVAVVFIVGVVGGIEYWTASFIGSGRESDIPTYFLTACGISLFLSSVFLILSVAALSYMAVRFTPTGLSFEMLIKYGYLTFFGYFAIGLQTVGRQILQIMGKGRSVSLIICLGCVLLIFVYSFIFSNYIGLPAESKLYYSAIALLVIRIIMAGSTLVLVHRSMKDVGKRKLSSSAFIDILRVGVPFGMMGVLEVGVFSLYAYLATFMGTASLAAHHIATSFVTAVFVLPSTLGVLSTIWIGYAFGRRDFPDILVRYKALERLAFWGAVSITVLIIVFREAIGSFWTDDPVVLEVLLSVLFVAAAFQMFDWFNIFLAGCFRGLGNTAIPALANALGHWAVGVPSAVILSSYFDFGVSGLWWGVLIGLLFSSGLAFVLFNRELRRINSFTAIAL
ncbi:MATE family efflux transporter [Paracoccus sp. 08]|uniref:MATE family efflux transporter n=1 Tax=Paracoccus sp. 08 TaxID=2606624 RepID=UPI0020943120|nr:MATE family efflux transporter [Paracoccus sp. 08]